jgi:hypothetical protein
VSWDHQPGRVNYLELKPTGLATPRNAISAFAAKVDKDGVRDDRHKVGGACACVEGSVE